MLKTPQFGIFHWLRIVYALRKNTYVVAADSRYERTLRCDRLGFDVSVQKIGILLQERRPGIVVSLAVEAGGGYQRGDVRGEGGGRITTDFLPTLLLGNRLP